jgi:predicted HTH domain antitoxin
MDAIPESFSLKLANLNRGRKILMVIIFSVGILCISLGIITGVYLSQQKKSGDQSDWESEDIAEKTHSVIPEHLPKEIPQDHLPTDIRKFFSQRNFCLNPDQMDIFEKFSLLSKIKVNELSDELADENIILVYNHSAQIISRAQEIRQKIQPSKLNPEVLKEIEHFFYDRSSAPAFLAHYFSFPTANNRFILRNIYQRISADSFGPLNLASDLVDFVGKYHGDSLGLDEIVKAINFLEIQKELFGDIDKAIRDKRKEISDSLSPNREMTTIPLGDQNLETDPPESILIITCDPISDNLNLAIQPFVSDNQLAMNPNLASIPSPQSLKLSASFPNFFIKILSQTPHFVHKDPSKIRDLFAYIYTQGTFVKDNSKMFLVNLYYKIPGNPNNSIQRSIFWVKVNISFLKEKFPNSNSNWFIKTLYNIFSWMKSQLYPTNTKNFKIQDSCKGGINSASGSNNRLSIISKSSNQTNSLPESDSDDPIIDQVEQPSSNRWSSMWNMLYGLLNLPYSYFYPEPPIQNNVGSVESISSDSESTSEKSSSSNNKEYLSFDEDVFDQPSTETSDS